VRLFFKFFKFLNFFKFLGGGGIFVLFQVQSLYEIAGLYSKTDGRGDVEKLNQLADLLNNLDAGDNIVVASSLSHMLNLGNLAEEVQIAYRRRVSKARRTGDIGDENSALTESDMEETFQRLLKKLKKSPQEIFEALKDQTVDLVFTAHPTQSIRRSLLQKHSRYHTLHLPCHNFFNFLI
jgi:phosphoenolpyruvate carboxylase